MNDANGNRLSASFVKPAASGTGSGSAATTTRTYSLTAGTNVLASIASTTSPGNATRTKTYQYDVAGDIALTTNARILMVFPALEHWCNGAVTCVGGMGGWLR